MIRITLKVTALFTLLGFGINKRTYAQDTQPINIVTTAVPFLRISPDARTGGMGDVGIATSPDANSGFYNLGKIPFNTSKASIGVTYTPWLKDLGLNDVYLASLAGYYKIDELQAVNGSLRYFSLGNIQFTDASGNDLNTFSPKEFGIDVGYSRKLSEKVGMGIGIKYIHSNLAGNVPATGQSFKAGNSVAGDIGVYYDAKNTAGTGWSLGGALTNLGGKIAYTDNADQK